MKNKKEVIVAHFLELGYHIEAASPAAVKVMSQFDYLTLALPLIRKDVERGFTEDELMLKYDLTSRQVRWYAKGK